MKCSLVCFSFDSFTVGEVIVCFHRSGSAIFNNQSRRTKEALFYSLRQRPIYLQLSRWNSMLNEIIKTRNGIDQVVRVKIKAPFYD